MVKYYFFLIGLIFMLIGCSQQKQELSKTYTNSIGMEFALIDSGSFMMGSNEKANEKPIHKVTVSKSFYLGTTEVTQEQWEKILGPNQNPSKFKYPQNPLESASWYHIRLFISKLNELEKTTKYRLPTEAEWEYAAGVQPDDLEKYAWYYMSGKTKTLQPNAVAQKEPNKWGLYDMYGNVWEWVEDWYDENYYTKSPEKDPINNRMSNNNIVKGGSCYNSIEFLRQSVRIPRSSDYKGDDVGFRIVFATE
ncbi:MAG: formylglycine-generating enzyme family protein [Campylobacteraceae bacterium]|jgi:formylglycine-generating enzyme required for sulfatase activity|nr:formylglycine-generating enzyme family protein [Campylobacteraceae bacterium]